MTAPFLTPIPGPAADAAGRLGQGVAVLRTPRTVLRAPCLEDATAWCTILMDDAAGHLGGPLGIEDAFTDFAATVGLWMLRGHGLWTVTDPQGSVLGFVLVGFEPGDREPELGFLFCAHARGRGLAFEAALAARNHALGPLGLPSLVSYIAADNAPSIALALRLGARRDPVAEAAIDHDCLVYRHIGPEIAA